MKNLLPIELELQQQHLNNIDIGSSATEVVLLQQCT
jgi:hypothetical protein